MSVNKVILLGHVGRDPDVRYVAQGQPVASFSLATTEHGYTNASSIRIEPKANGLSVIDQLREVSRLNVVATPSPADSKETRLNAASPAVESGRVVLVEGAWKEELIDEVCGFPAKPHDEYVDVLCYALNYHLDNPFKPIDKARTARMIY